VGVLHKGFLDFCGSVSQEVLPILSHPPRLLHLSKLHFVLESRGRYCLETACFAPQVFIAITAVPLPDKTILWKLT
jgi:hypothetical protein